MSTAKAANNLVLNPKLDKEKLKTFIPIYRTIRSGIVKNIPQHYNEVDLLEFFDAPYKVIEVKRLNRRIRIEGETKYISSRTVCLKFTGQILPKCVYLCRTRHKVYPFVKICFSCYRIGYISKACRGKPRCIFCGKDVHDPKDPCSNRNNSSCCINCKGDPHLISSHDCSVVARHKLILSLVAAENIPLIDARRKIQGTSISTDTRYDFTNFLFLY